MNFMYHECRFPQQKTTEKVIKSTLKSYIGPPGLLCLIESSLLVKTPTMSFGQNCTTPLSWDKVGIERQYVGIHPKSVGIHPIHPNFMPSQTPTIHP